MSLLIHPKTMWVKVTDHFPDPGKKVDVMFDESWQQLYCVFFVSDHFELSDYWILEDGTRYNLSSGDMWHYTKE